MQQVLRHWTTEAQYRDPERRETKAVSPGITVTSSLSPAVSSHRVGRKVQLELGDVAELRGNSSELSQGSQNP
jgi:hypothetical protein